jgi:hypothetical protein
MKLELIDKATYRAHLKRVTAGVVALLLVSAVGISTLLIAVFGEPGESNFTLNLTGVAIGASLCGFLLYYFREHAYMVEVMYAWRLKQELNRIYRRSAKVRGAVDRDNRNGLIISNFHLKGSKQLYELDDNTLTMDELNQKIQQLDAKMQGLGVTVSLDDYDKRLLNQLD